MQRKHIFLLLFILCLSATKHISAQDKPAITLNLKQTVKLANDSSLSAFSARNKYMAGYWEYRSFKAERLPSLTLFMTPLRYYRDFTKRYDSQTNTDIYRRQQSLYTHGNLMIQQNLDITGGTFFLDTELGYLHNFGDIKHSQFTSVPIRLGYRQSLIGYNPFKWAKRIEPIKFQKVQQELISNIEETAERAVSYFFDLALAQVEYELAIEAQENTEKLYQIGEERHKIASIGEADLNTLKLDRINARNSVRNAEIRLKRAMFALAAFLNMDKNSNIVLDLPGYPKQIDISVEEALIYARDNNPKYLESQQKLLESKRHLDKTKKEAMFDAGLTASIGFNQVAEDFLNAYRHPLQQDIVSLTLTIPIIDWGVRKGRYNMAKSNLNIVELANKQNEIRLEEDIVMTVGDFIVQQQLIVSAEEAVKLAKVAYQQTQDRFIIGKADINSLTLSTNRRQQAERNYITALRNYWLSYYKIRRITLYDFEKDSPITVEGVIND